MDEENQKSAKALQTALQMEIDGKEFYLKSGENSTNDLARKLFHYLAEQEDVHYRIIKEIHGKIEVQQAWPDVETAFKHGKSLQNVFKEAVEALGKNVDVASSELEAIKTAMNMEDRSYSFYRSRGEEAVSPVEKAFYQALTAEERTHYLTLADSYDYLSDPQGWFTKTEHPSLDGA